MLESLFLGVLGFCLSWKTYLLVSVLLYVVAYVCEVELGTDERPPPGISGLIPHYLLSNPYLTQECPFY